ncbi:MAG TPA: glycine cleavage T C-terminal barrel domain-containing protein [Pyrinomonadaceae bacterium]|nr:glycine cleavage T C-terminal barrel domain-containing protein [Pyrinomonadaceae bacterium]
MNEKDLENYWKIRNGEVGFYKQKRGLIEVSGKEAVQFLNGLITNDVAKLEENSAMLAAFPNAQGRLLAVVRVLKKDGKFLFETEEKTHEKVYNNLFRFTFAGDFFVEDLSEKYEYVSISNSKFQIPDSIEFEMNFGKDIFVPKENAGNFESELKSQNAVEISVELYEVLRIENGIPLYGVDMDESTIVPELGIDGLISYNKGCYIGQEIIARIYFRGHVAKQLRGLIIEDEAAEISLENELKSPEGKNAGKITSFTFSPKLNKYIALSFVRYEFLATDTELFLNDRRAKVKQLPFIEL